MARMKMWITRKGKRYTALGNTQDYSGVQKLRRENTMFDIISQKNARGGYAVYKRPKKEKYSKNDYLGYRRK